MFEGVAIPRGRFKCPECGSIEGSIELATATLERKCHCPNCKHTWTLGMFEMPAVDPLFRVKLTLKDLEDARLRSRESELPKPIVITSNTDAPYWAPVAEPHPHKDLEDAIAYMTKMAASATRAAGESDEALRNRFADMRAAEGTLSGLRRSLSVVLNADKTRVEENQDDHSIEVSCYYDDADRYADALSNRDLIMERVHSVVPVGVLVKLRIKSNSPPLDERAPYDASDEEAFLFRLRSKLAKLK